MSDDSAIAFAVMVLGVGLVYGIYDISRAIGEWRFRRRRKRKGGKP